MPKFYEQIFKNIASDANLANHLSLVCKASDDLKQEILNCEIAAFNMVASGEAQEWQNHPEISRIQNFKKVLVIGVGGSSLGAKVFCAIKSQNKVQFLESIDPDSIADSLQALDLANCFFLVISKSGETIETICQTLIIVELLQQVLKNSQSIGQQFLFITDSTNNSLAAIAQKIGSKILFHPQNLGGRFSCFSIVGLLPAMLAGIDIKKLLNAAKDALDLFLKTNSKNCHIVESCAAQIFLYEKGFINNVLMPYIDNYKNFVDWYRQLWAESLGKNGFGSTPINSQGTIDQHSQLQLYLEGKRDKFFTFITKKEYETDFLVIDLPDCKTMFGGKKLSQIIAIEEQTTIESLNLKQLPIRQFVIKHSDEATIAALMIQIMLETIIIAKAKAINPFDQPAVELRKEMAKKLLKNF